LKKVVFLIIATVLVVGLVLPGCAGGGGGGEGGGGGGEDTRPPITFAIADAMTDVRGKNAWEGAELARDEINSGAGINVGGVYHKIALVKVDTNEMSGTPEEGVAALQAVIDDVDFVVGGFNSYKVDVYREVAMDVQKIFMDCGAGRGALQGSVVTNYDRYKYWFKVTPQNEYFLISSLFKMMGTFSSMLKDKLISAGDAVAEGYQVPEDGRLRVAIIAEDAEWWGAFATIIGGLVNTSSGYNLVGRWKVSPTATDISTELTEIAGKHPQIIIPVFWGPVGTVYSLQKAELGIPAMTIGFNLLDAEKSHWTATEGKCNGEILLDTWAEGLENTAKTTAFFNAFVAKTNEYPFSTAATYDAIYQMKVAIEAVSAANGWNKIANVVKPDNIDALIQYLETQPYTGTASTIAYYPMPEVRSTGYKLSEAQVRALYPSLATYDISQWLVDTAGAMAGPHIAHDIVYGPGYTTGIGSQWQDGKKMGVWPIDLGDAYDAAMTDQYGCWNFEYPGTVDVMIPIEGFLAS
jgi:branched-chain amino acid transport system substrate-binding protein